MNSTDSQRAKSWASPIQITVVLVAAAVFVSSTCAHGIPLVRHDWDWPTSRTTAWWWALDRMSGWRLENYGEPNAYPTLYVISPLRFVLIWAFGPLGGLLTYLAIVAIILQGTALRFAASFSGRDDIRILVGPLALLNPWTYNQCVAGHIEMILALAGIFLALSAFPRYSRASFLLASLLCLAQLQFFLLLIALYAMYATVIRRVLPLLDAIVLFLPIAIAAIINSHSFEGIPFNYDWQLSQSVPMGRGLFLGGYFAGYADRVEPFEWFVLGIVFVLAVTNFQNRSTRKTLLFLVGAIVAIVVAAAGLRGPLAGLYGAGISSLHVLGVYRELYDLVGLALVPYVAIVAIIKPCRLTMVLQGSAVLVAFLAWAIFPPTRFFVPQSDVTESGGEIVSGRFALSPAFQPMTWKALGSGVDPELRIRSLDSIPLNAYWPTYPTNVALARMQRDGAFDLISKLGVTSIVSRCVAVTERYSINVQSATSSRVCTAGKVTLNGARAPVRVIPRPKIAVIDQSLSGSILAGDYLADYVVPTSDSGTTDAARAWVDARLYFSKFPELGQAYGGAYTSSEVPLEVEPGAYILAWVDGQLVADDGRQLARHGSFAWLGLSESARRLKCRGRCEVVLEAKSEWRFPFERPQASDRVLPSRRLFFFAYETEVRARAGDLIALNERYDPGWVAITRVGTLKSERVDGVSNGFVIPQDIIDERAFLVYLPSIAQGGFELFALLYMLLAFDLKRRIISWRIG